MTLIVAVILTKVRIVSCLVDKTDPDFHQDDKLGNRHSGLDPESVLMPRADPVRQLADLSG